MRRGQCQGKRRGWDMGGLGSEAGPLSMLSLDGD